MLKANKEVLKTVAEKLMFDLNESEYELLLNDFSLIDSFIDILNEIEELDNVEPMVLPFGLSTTYLREDVSEEPLDRDVALKNASKVKDGQIVLPKVVK